MRVAQTCLCRRVRLDMNTFAGLLAAYSMCSIYRKFTCTSLSEPLPVCPSHTNSTFLRLVFVERPTYARVRHNAFLLWGSGAGPEPTHARRFQKCLDFHRHSPKKKCFRRQAINLVPPRRVRTYGTGPWNPR